MSRIVPEVVSANRSEGSRVKIATRYHERFKKSHVIAYTLWFISCGLGAHRFYLKRWNIALVILGVFITNNLMLLMSDRENWKLFFWLIIILIYIIEGVLLYENVNKYNARLLKQINNEVGLKP